MAHHDSVQRVVGHGRPGRRAGLPVGRLSAGNGVVISELERLLWTAAHPLPVVPPSSGPPGIESTPGQSWRPRRASWPTNYLATAELVTVQARPPCGTLGCTYRRRVAKRLSVTSASTPPRYNSGLYISYARAATSIAQISICAIPDLRMAPI